MSGRGHDRLLFTAVLILVGLGVVMVYSASAIRAQERFGDPAFFLKKQILWALIGVTGMVWLMGRDYRGLRPFILPLLFLAFGMLVLVLVPGIGVKVNGARRWLRLLGFSFQPAELAKLALVGYLARLLADKEEPRSRSQRRAPFTLTPSPGTSTRTSIPNARKRRGRMKGRRPR
ncbi:MAG: FtsW/RodA/SpoVE family cell cycle protein, partial [candidate division NC10 bacterium]|nr:FtsW/RodA/SpoVE family cell cycle protein [candidate division NC10 bacterium]